jgi:hypothetical protein
LVGEVRGGDPDPPFAVGVTLARYTVRAAALSAGSPAATLDSRHRVVSVAAEEEVSGRWCDVLVVFARRANGVVELCAAGSGNPPGLIVRGDGTLTTVAPGGKLAGWDPDVSFAPIDAHLLLGDVLLLFTRGLADLQRLEIVDQLRLRGTGTRVGPPTVARVLDRVRTMVDSGAVRLSAGAVALALGSE